MLDRVEERFDMKPQRLIGDMAYGAADVLGWLVEQKQIAPHIPVWDKSQRTDGTLSASDFVWDEQANEYRLRGPSGARDEFLLAATAQNLRRMAKWLAPMPVT